MLAQLGDQIVSAKEQIILARFKATLADTPELRREYRRLERRWRELARTLEFATAISGFLEWRAQRLEPPP
jgi:hypothetical protein